jgi:basic membrane protein A and related proteins
MMRRRLALVALLAVFGLIVAACGDDEATTTSSAVTTTEATTTTAAPTTTEAPTTTAGPTTTMAPSAKICQVTDVGGIDDQSFNQTAWKGMEQARDTLGVTVEYLESQAATDYRPNIDSFVTEGCDLIITVGFLLAGDTAAAACDYPDQRFAIIDQLPEFYPGSSWADADGNALCDFSKVRGLTFQTDEAAFLAGYLAAGMTTSGVVGTFGGMNIPPVTIFMDGFVKGVAYYNTINGTAVTALGWNTETLEGLFTGNFESLDDGRAFAENLNDEGADIIMPVAGPVGLGTAAACMERGCLVVGVDADWYNTAQDYRSIELTSVLKNMDAAVLNTITNVLNLGAVGNLYVGTLANGGVGLAPYHDLEAQVPAELAAAMTQLQADIIAAGGLAAFLAPPE